LLTIKGPACRGFSNGFWQIPDFPGANGNGQIMQTINFRAEKVSPDALAVAQRLGGSPKEQALKG
jgi:hypothetical protein